jgi:hypothetical protein
LPKVLPKALEVLEPELKAPYVDFLKDELGFLNYDY